MVPRSTDSATLPSTRRPRPLRPCVHITIRVGLLGRRRLDDRRGGGTVPHVRLDTLDPFVREPPDDGRKIFLGLPDRGHLGLDRIGAQPGIGFGRP